MKKVADAISEVNETAIPYSSYITEAEALIKALAARGLVIVPLIPTDEMRDAGDSLDAYAEDNDYIRKADASQHWDAMITTGRLK